MTDRALDELTDTRLQSEIVAHRSCGASRS
jgi:hypothetical protein